MAFYHTSSPSIIVVDADHMTIKERMSTITSRSQKGLKTWRFETNSYKAIDFTLHLIIKLRRLVKVKGNPFYGVLCEEYSMVLPQ